jgi:hypothetical protein
MPNTGDTIAIWFSCGAASAVAAKLAIERYASSCHIRVLNNPIAEEDDDNRRFLKDVESWIGVPIETVASKRYPSNSAVAVWEHRKYMSGPTGAPCTVELKKHARQEWERINKADWHVLGFTADERKRHERFVLTERSNVLPGLIDAKITKDLCYAILKLTGIELPRIYSLGYPNANCIGCVKATSSTYWNHVRKVHPTVFEQRAEQSRRIGAKLVRHNGERMFLDELPSDAKGKPMKGMDFECGIFCEERPQDNLSLPI